MRELPDGTEVVRIEDHEYAVLPGYKAPGDRVLVWRYVGEWRPVTLDHAFLHTDYIAANEDLLNPYPKHGGEEVIRYLRLARQKGWPVAVAKMQEARARHNDPRAYDGP